VLAELVEDEDVRVARLLDAQAKAAELFADVETRGLIAPGIGERRASDAIRDLAIAGDQAGNYIMPGSGEPMRRTDRTGTPHRPPATRSTAPVT
jgi:hypothetical protein